MKKIFFIRHAKSDWSIPGLADVDRPLNQRGYSDAHRVGAQLKKNINSKTLFVSSHAIRALSTALIIARETNYPPGKILICPELYEAETSDYKTLIKSLDNHFENVFIFGHNPTISEIISDLSNTNVGEVSTCAVFVLGFEAEHWRDTKDASATIEFNFSPKTLSE